MDGAGAQKLEIGIKGQWGWFMIFGGEPLCGSGFETMRTKPKIKRLFGIRS